MRCALRIGLDQGRLGGARRVRCVVPWIGLDRGCLGGVVLVEGVSLELAGRASGRSRCAVRIGGEGVAWVAPCR